MDSLASLQERLAINFNNSALLLRAVTHRSYVNENPEQMLDDNERLEFLGDAVLDFLVGAYLYQRFPEMKEGELTMLRSALVRTGRLAVFARKLDVGAALRLGFGEAESGGRARTANLGAAFEAIVGAIYLDQGMEVLGGWIVPFIEPALDEIIAQSAHRDAKSEFQILAQARYNLTPRYKLLAAEGPDHDKLFTVAVLLGDVVWGQGTGGSKQHAEQQAARVALDAFRHHGEQWDVDNALAAEADE